MATRSYKRLRGLSIEQQNAIDLLIQGETDEAAAAAVRVHRVTVTNWRNHDPYFQAELNRRRNELWGSATERLRTLIGPALDAIEEGLGTPGSARSRLAMDLLRLVGLDAARSLRLEAAGPSNPEAIIDGLARAQRRTVVDDLREACGEGPVTDSERQMVLNELMDKCSRPEVSDTDH